MAKVTDVKTVKVGRKTYPVRLPERMNRKQIRALKDAHLRANENDVEALWEIFELFVPGCPSDVVDELTAGEIGDILRTANLMAGDVDSPTVGESSASRS